MVFQSRSSGATHPHTAFLWPFTLPFLLTDKCTYTYAKKSECTRTLRTHSQICWSLCTQIKLMTPCMKSQWTKPRCCQCPPLPAISSTKTRRERSMIYQSVSVVSAWGWFTNTQHTARRREPPSVEWCCGVDLIKHMQPRLSEHSSFPIVHCVANMDENKSESYVMLMLHNM